MDDIKKIIKYLLTNLRIAIILFYFVMFGIMVLITASLVRIEAAGAESTLGGLETGIIIFLFIIGLDSFRENFRMMIQNGVSRKTMFKGFICTSLILSAGMSLINEISLHLGKAFASAQKSMEYKGVFEQVYAQRYIEHGGSVQMAFEGLLFLICLSMSMIMLGYLITIFYYYLNKYAKVAVSVSVPVLLIIVLPILDFSITGGVIFNTFWSMVAFAFGLKNGFNPYYGIITSLLCLALFTSLSWMLVRRAQVKD